MRMNIWTLTFLAVGFLPTLPCVADEPAMLVREWIKRLSGTEQAVREAAAQSLIDMTWAVIGTDKADEVTVDKDLYQQLLLKSRRNLVEVATRPNAKSSDPAVAAAITCLAVAKNDGSVLRETMSEKRGDAALELLAVRTLLSTGPYTMTAEKTVLPMILRDIRQLSPEARKHADARWRAATSDSLDSVGVQLSLVGLAQTLIETNRTLKEMPYLIKALDAEFPSFVRHSAIDVLAELGGESHSSIPKLRLLLKDESKRIRIAAAHAIVRIRCDPSIAPSLSTAARLEDEERTGFLEWSREFGKSTLPKKLGNDDRRAFESLILKSLKSPHPYYQREALRMAVRLGLSPRLAKPRVQELVNAPDAETRKLAKRVFDQ